MTKHSALRTPRSAVLIVGGGPAGAGLAIRLAMRGGRVTLLEKDRFPREKLCGEFVSPECLSHFDELGVRERIEARGGDRVFETRFFARAGSSVGVPTHWFGGGEFALSVSRAEMDAVLLDRARELGVEVIEGARVLSAATEGDRISYLRARLASGNTAGFTADLFVDATGRSAVLSRTGHPERSRDRGGLVAFKAHLRGVLPKRGVCEIYFFDGGYGGLSHVERGKANFCFIVKGELAREFIGNTNQLFRTAVRGNARAIERLGDAEPLHDWLAVSIGGFGFAKRTPIENLIPIGDARAFIDPFTGSGMLMALQSSSLLAACLEESEAGFGGLGARYEAVHAAHFRRRLRVSRLLRRAAFHPSLASAAIFLAGRSDFLRRSLARGTRSGPERLREEY